MRAALFALALSVAAPALGQTADPPAPAKRDRATVQAWTTAHLKLDGYRAIYGDDELVTLFRFVAVQDVEGAVVRGWVRDEFLDPPSTDRAYRSTDTLYDFDCADMRLRAVARDTYARLNRVGEPLDRENLQDPAWTYARLGSLEEDLLDAACAAQVKALEALIDKAKADNARGQAARAQAADAKASEVRQ